MVKPIPESARFWALGIATLLLVAASLYLVFLPDADRQQVKAWMGDPAAQYALALALSRGDGVTEDDAAALEWFRKAAERGHAKACMTMSRLYFTGDGVPQDDKLGAEWLRRAASGGSSFAQAMTGLLYMGGIGVAQDTAEAEYWLLQSKELEAEMMLKDLKRNQERISALELDQREKATAAFLARKKLYTGELFAKLMKKMQQQEKKGDEDDGY
jgi:TPR repeat protein